MTSPKKLAVPYGTSATPALVYRAEGAPLDRTLVLGHGAGAGQDSVFMVAFSRALAALGVDVVTFDFPYIQERRKIPDRPPVLEGCYRAVIEAARDELAPGKGFFIGGKSMGGRIATQVAAADRSIALDGLVLLGYPLHPIGKPTELRAKHLPAIGRPMLFVQGSRDAFGTPAELEPVLETISPAPVLHVVDGGDHSFKIPRRDSAAQAAVYANVQQAIVSWMSAISPAGTSTP